MKKTFSLYHVEEPEDLILRDYLARDRTELASERTLLSYIRTFLGLFGAGTACIKLISDSLLLSYLGYLFILVSPVFLIVGICRYYRVKKRLQSIPDNQLLIPPGDKDAGSGEKEAKGE